jgi:hypothetical protein
MGILAGLLEPAGFVLAGTINAFSYIAWSVWMVVLGVTAWRAARVKGETQT